MASTKITSFTPKWIDNYQWIHSVPKEKFKAYCKYCKEIFPIIEGEAAVKKHAESSKHTERAQDVASMYYIPDLLHSAKQIISQRMTHHP